MVASVSVTETAIFSLIAAGFSRSSRYTTRGLLPIAAVDEDLRVKQDVGMK